MPSGSTGWSIWILRAMQIQRRRPVQGNLDPLALLAGGAALDRSVDAILAALAGGPFIFNLGHGILPETPIAHVEQMLKRVRRVIESTHGETPARSYRVVALRYGRHAVILMWWRTVSGSISGSRLLAFHIIAVIAWMAGMLYLPRLFVYHCEAEPGSRQSETFKVMERRLLQGDHQSGDDRDLGARACGSPGRAAGSPRHWLHVKLAAGAGHVGGARHPVQIRARIRRRPQRRKSAKFFRFSTRYRPS